MKDQLKCMKRVLRRLGLTNKGATDPFMHAMLNFPI